MGQLSQGAPRALYSQVLRYGFRTISGSTLGVSVDAPATAASARKSGRIVCAFLFFNKTRGKEWYSSFPWLYPYRHKHRRPNEQQKLKTKYCQLELEVAGGKMEEREMVSLRRHCPLLRCRSVKTGQATRSGEHSEYPQRGIEEEG